MAAPITTPESVADEAKKFLAGGIWTDENLKQSLEWTGEAPITTVVEGSTARLSTTSGRAGSIEELTSDQDLDPKIVDLVSSLTHRLITRDLGAGGTSIRVSINKIMDERSGELKKWVTEQLDAVDKVLRTSQDSGVRELRDKIDLLTTQVNELVKTSLTRSEAENAIMAQAMQMVQEAKSQHSDQATDDQERFAVRQAELEEEIKALKAVQSTQPVMTPQPPNTASKGKVRGRLF
jgi:hypothetical protein